MHPLIVKKLKRIEEQLSELGEVLEAKDQEIEKFHVRRDELQQEIWRQRKEISTVNRIAEDYDAVETELNSFKAERDAIRSKAEPVLNITKALRSAIES